MLLATWPSPVAAHTMEHGCTPAPACTHTAVVSRMKLSFLHDWAGTVSTSQCNNEPRQWCLKYACTDKCIDGMYACCWLPVCIQRHACMFTLRSRLATLSKPGGGHDCSNCLPFVPCTASRHASITRARVSMHSMLRLLQSLYGHTN